MEAIAHAWRVDKSDGGDIHVQPNFGRAHHLVGLNCWCHPEMDDPEADLDWPIVVIHNAEN